MDLPNLLNKLKPATPPPQRFVAIEITPYAIKSAIWQAVGDKTEVISIGSVQSWDTNDENDLLSAVDLSLSDAYAGTDSEPNQVILGLPETWVSADGIADQKKPIIRNICRKLALKPVGFVVSTEAIIHYLKDKEGGPPSAILINLSPQEIAVSQVYLGNLTGTQVVGRSPSLAADVAEGLARFPRTDSLPSRMVLYDAREDLENAKQELISHDWQSKLPFLHFPKIESLGKDVSIQAIALSGGAEVIKSLGLVTPETESAVPPPSLSLIPSPQPEPESEPQLTTVAPPPVSPEPLPSGPETDFGFQSVAVAPDQATAPEVIIEPSHPSTSATLTPVPDVLPPTPVSRSSIAKIFSGFKRRLQLRPRTINAPRIGPPPKVSFKRLSFSPKASLIFGSACLILLLLGGFAAYWFIPQATVTIFVTPQPLIKEVTFTLNPNLAAVDLSKAAIPGHQEDVTVTGQKSTPTTGTKTIGDKAKGKATIYNRTTSQKNFPAGTTLKSNNLLFYTSEAISLASGSAQSNADFSLTIQPTKVEVNIVAGAIGDQYNLSAGTQLSVQNFGADSYIGNAATALSGGFSKQVQVVAQKDADNLLKDLQQQLESQMVSQESQKTNGELGVIPTGSATTTDKTYDHKVNDEADTLSLNLTLKESVFTYSLADVTLMAEAAVQNDIPPDFTVNAKDTQVVVDKTTLNSDGTINIVSKISLNLLPKINTQAVSDMIKGKFPAVTQTYFATLPGFNKVAINLEPKLPPGISTFPRLVNHIKVTVQPVGSP